MAPEHLSWGAGAVTFLLFSTSQFQLPHYVNILFPFFSIIAASWIVGLQGVQARRRASQIQWGIAFIVFAASPILLWSAQVHTSPLAIAWVAIGFAALWIVYFRTSGRVALVASSLVAAASAYGTLNIYFYPWLLGYQAPTALARWMQDKGANEIVAVEASAYSFEFYADQALRRSALDALASTPVDKPLLVFGPVHALEQLKASGLVVNELQHFDSFPVTRLTFQFFNPRTRSSAFGRAAIAEVAFASSRPEEPPR